MPVVLVDNDTSEKFTVTEPACKIGTAPSNNIMLSGEDISPVHVRLEKRGDDWFVALEPGGAATKKMLIFITIPNCTHNGKQLEGKLEKISNGDKLQIGSRLLVFHIL